MNVTAASSTSLTITMPPSSIARSTDVWVWVGAFGYRSSYEYVAEVPDAPTSVVATAGEGMASVDFAAPAYTGGVPIQDYLVMVSPNGLLVPTATSPATIIGLDNGTVYTFTVVARNSAGDSAPSDPSNAVTPQADQFITFTSPTQFDFGTSPTVTASATSGLAVEFASSAPAVCSVTPAGQLTFHTAGACVIAATQSGNAVFKAAPPVEQWFYIAPVLAGAPTNIVATAGDTQASVSFDPPTDTGGEITSFTVWTSPPDVPPIVTTASPVVVYGLTNGRDYRFTVTADNGAGSGPTSVASDPVTPAASQTVTFVNPGAQPFGTSPTLSASSDSGLAPTFATSTPAVCTVSPAGLLTFLSAGTCTIIASQSGSGGVLPASPVEQSFAVEAIAPDAPTSVSAVANAGSAEVSFVPPAFTGGAAIHSYRVTASPGGLFADGTSIPITIAGLTNGTIYTFVVTATNSGGTSPLSTPSNAVTPQATQSISFANPGDQLFSANPTLTASASSGLPVSFSSTTPATCTIAGTGQLTALATGTCTIAADQEGDAGNLPAPTVTQGFAILPDVITLNPAPGALPTGRVLNAYSQVFSASGGTAPYSFAITAGAVPSGLTFGVDTILGTPDTDGVATFTLTVTDGNGFSASEAYSLTIHPPMSIVLSPSGGALSPAMAGEDYSTTISASGPSGPFVFRVTSGALPDGMLLNSATGELTGPLEAATEGDYSFTIETTAAGASPGTGTYSLTVRERAVTVGNRTVVVSPGATPLPIDLTAGATGGPFTTADVISVEPPQAGTARIVGADVASAGPTSGTGAGFYLRFLPNPQYSGTALVTYTLGSALGTSAPGTVTYSLTLDPAAVSATFGSLSDSFISSRAGLLAGSIDVSGLAARRGLANAQAPGSIQITPDGNSLTMNFAASSLALTAASTAAESLALQPINDDAVNFWIDGTGTLHLRTDRGLDHWGSLAMISMGADMLVNEDLLAGVALHVDWMDDITSDSRVVGQGMLIGPYVSAELVDGVFLEASAYYGRSWNTISTDLFRGSFETNRLMANVSLEGTWTLSEDLVLRPSAKLFYLHESADAYGVRDGAGTTVMVDGHVLDQLRLTAGAVLQYALDFETFTARPFVGIDLGLAINSASQSVLGSVSAGVDLAGTGNWTLGLSTKASFEGTSFRSISASARLGVSF